MNNKSTNGKIGQNTIQPTQSFWKKYQLSLIVLIGAVLILVVAGIFVWYNSNQLKKAETIIKDEANRVQQGSQNASQPAVDSDNDNLSDQEEVQYGTDPKKADTDGDSINDGDEIKVYFSNPLVKDVDSDNDNFTDQEEMKYGTDPQKADTDGDGLNDGDEVKIYLTNPLLKDTDADGLSDGDEILKWKTDPISPDTDNDGFNDGDEVNKGYDPLRKDKKIGEE